MSNLRFVDRERLINGGKLLNLVEESRKFCNNSHFVVMRVGWTNRDAPFGSHVTK